MESKHTPGPWKADRRAIILDRPPTMPSGTEWYEQVATVEAGKDAQANARLIAAAPELLAKLLRLYVATGCLYDGDAGRIPSVAEMEAVTLARRDALTIYAKATGTN